VIGLAISVVNLAIWLVSALMRTLDLSEEAVVETVADVVGMGTEISVTGLVIGVDRVVMRPVIALMKTPDLSAEAVVEIVADVAAMETET